MTAPKPVVLCILDGWGARSDQTANAPALADTPTFDRIMATCPTAQLITHGPDVGLPTGQMGNSVRFDPLQVRIDQYFRGHGCIIGPQSEVPEGSSSEFAKVACGVAWPGFGHRGYLQCRFAEAYPRRRPTTITSISSSSTGRRPHRPAVPPQTLSTANPHSSSNATSSGTM